MLTIALVDDDHNILTSVSVAFEAEGYRVMTYTDGGAALEPGSAIKPDPGYARNRAWVGNQHFRCSVR